MMRRILATSLVWLCVLTALVLPAFGQSVQNQNGTNQNGTKQNGTTSVPEPSATLLVALGLGGVGAFEWRRRVREGAKRQSS